MYIMSQEQDDIVHEIASEADVLVCDTVEDGHRPPYICSTSAKVQNRGPDTRIASKAFAPGTLGSFADGCPARGRG